MEAPMCPLCKIRECDQDTEPGRDWKYYESAASYSYTCSTCSLMGGIRDHSHQHYPSPAQVAAGTFKAGHSWRTAERLEPVWENGQHIGYRCGRFFECGWEEIFTAEQREPCHEHTTHGGYPIEVMKGVCVNYREHRLARGECYPPHGYITEYGREQENKRSDAAVWDPGRYIPIDR